MDGREVDAGGEGARGDVVAADGAADGVVVEGDLRVEGPVGAVGAGVLDDVAGPVTAAGGGVEALKGKC